MLIFELVKLFFVPAIQVGRGRPSKLMNIGFFSSGCISTSVLFDTSGRFELLDVDSVLLEVDSVLLDVGANVLSVGQGIYPHLSS